MLAAIGINMIKEALEEDEKTNDDVCCREMLILAIATSIDALAMGISFSCMGYTAVSSLWYPLASIGIVSFVMSLFGVLLGVKCGRGIGKKLRAEMLGGIILVGIGAKVLFEHI